MLVKCSSSSSMRGSSVSTAEDIQREASCGLLDGRMGEAFNKTNLLDLPQAMRTAWSALVFLKAFVLLVRAWLLLETYLPLEGPEQMREPLVMMII